MELAKMHGEDMPDSKSESKNIFEKIQGRMGEASVISRCPRFFISGNVQPGEVAAITGKDGQGTSLVS